MSIEFLITIATMIIGFMSIFIMLAQFNHQINSRIDSLSDSTNERFDSLRTEFKTELNRIETRFDDDIKELRGLIIGLYTPRLSDRGDKDVA